MRLNYPDPFVPFAGAFPTGSGKPAFVSDRMAQCGLDPVPDSTSSHERSQRGAALAREFPLALITPADHYLLIIFNNAKQRRRSGAATLLIRPDDAAPRCITKGDEVRIGNVRGTFLPSPMSSDRVRPAWWPAARADGLAAPKRARRSMLLLTIGTRTWALVGCIATTAYASTSGRILSALAVTLLVRSWLPPGFPHVARRGAKRVRSKPKVESGVWRECCLNPEN
jgi:anaerobic selenocysteine-containing dehydrogenase